MEKRYQVFLSSTYEDLREERSAAILSLLKLNCFPAGMELFPSSDDSVWQVIKKTIAESDYYVLIIAGRYGSISNDGVTSWTEREYDYAQEIGKPTFVFLYKDVDDITKGKIDNEEKVRAFREKVGKRFCVTCDSIDSLRAEVTVALFKAIQEFPAIGWVRGNASEKKPSSAKDTFEKEKMVCLGIADKILTGIDYDDWYFWTSWLTSADGPSLALDRERALENMITYINKSAIWPNSFPRVKAAFENFAAVAKDLLKQFFKHAEIRSATSDRYTTKKFYKIPEDNPHYKEDSAKYDKHVDIIHAYTFELTRAINYACDIIREDVDKTYRTVDGKRYITRGYEQGGFYDYFPKYRDEELKDGKPPYPGAEAFLRRLGIS